MSNKLSKTTVNIEEIMSLKKKAFKLKPLLISALAGTTIVGGSFIGVGMLNSGNEELKTVDAAEPTIASVPSSSVTTKPKNTSPEPFKSRFIQTIGKSPEIVTEICQEKINQEGSQQNQKEICQTYISKQESRKNTGTTPSENK